MGAWALLGDLRDAAEEFRSERLAVPTRYAAAKKKLDAAREALEQNLIDHPEWFGVSS
jgi:hypothetical protein